MSDRIKRLPVNLAVAFVCLFTLPLNAQTVIPAVATITIAQGGPAQKTVQAETGYEVAVHTLANRLVSQLQSAGQKSATVLDFTDLQGQGTELGRFLAQELSDRLVAGANTLSLVDRANLQFLLKENKLSMEGLVDPQSSRKLGNMIGIDTVIQGTVTPLGNSVRLSVRAIAVETGKVVAAQSITVPAVGGLGEMYTHGLVSKPGELIAERKKPDIRGRFRADSLKVSGRDVLIGGSYFAAGDATLIVQNLSGISIEAAIQNGSTSINGCSGPETRSSGLGLIGPPVGSILVPSGQFTYLPANGKLVVKIEMSGCQGPFRNVKALDVGTTLLVRADGQTLTLPVIAADVPVRLGANAGPF